MRKLASKMRDEVEEAEENKVDVRKEDKTMKPFTIEFEHYVGPMLTIKSLSLMDNDYNVVHKNFSLELKKGDRYLLK